MPFYPTESIKYTDFRQSCRAFKPSELLPLIAATSADTAKIDDRDSYIHTLPPWGLAAAARESILSGNELRSKPATLFELRGLMERFKTVHDVTHEDIDDIWFPVKLLTGYAFEQVPFSHSTFYDLCRSYSIFVDGPRRAKTKIIDDAAMREIFDGHALTTVISSAFLIYVGVLNNMGIFDVRWLTQDNFASVREKFSVKCTADLLESMTSDIHSMRKDFKLVTGHDYCDERFDYNPLISSPFVDLGSTPPICPVPEYILRSITPEGIFYKGVRKFGSAFADDLGSLFELYVGQQLQQIPNALVYPEICIDRKAGREKSVDWFVIFPDLVILVEVKSTRMNREARMGKDETVQNLGRTIDKARLQISRSLDSIINDVPEYGKIPKDRAFLGLIITAEPFPLWEGYLEASGGAFISDNYREDEPSSRRHPLTLASIRDLEELITHGDDVNQIIVELMKDKSFQALHIGNIAPSQTKKNGIVVDSWRKIFPDLSDGK
ncbi:hypothetical protein [Corynebacterium glyciniphilum]|uniref:hypothetical protein n=1 Tax=Corynebacterium glyciniphilum TaxID=1404244 RepID=UPI0011AB4A13|nr:hypothetical protein [Corynebacterium glyciniphilum]